MLAVSSEPRIAVPSPVASDQFARPYDGHPCRGPDHAGGTHRTCTYLAFVPLLAFALTSSLWAMALNAAARSPTPGPLKPERRARYRALPSPFHTGCNATCDMASIR